MRSMPIPPSYLRGGSFGRYGSKQYPFGIRGLSPRAMAGVVRVTIASAISVIVLAFCTYSKNSYVIKLCFVVVSSAPPCRSAISIPFPPTGVRFMDRGANSMRLPRLKSGFAPITRHVVNYICGYTRRKLSCISPARIERRSG